MTLMEILIVVSLIGMVSIAIYTSLSLGAKVWKRSQSALIEQDLALFFDRITRDLHRTFYFASLPPEGGMHHFSFPSVVEVIPDKQRKDMPTGYTDEIGKVEYRYDSFRKTIIRKQARYASAVNGQFDTTRVLAGPVESFQIRYIYLVESGEETSDTVLQTMPASIEIRVEFSDSYGRREITKFVDIPLSM